nr:MAG TPA: hypothetical protein [Caudoviricetes sp.]
MRKLTRLVSSKRSNNIKIWQVSGKTRRPLLYDIIKWGI